MTDNINSGSNQYDVISKKSLSSKDNNTDNNNFIKKCTTNHALLKIACLTFGLFVIAEIIGALASGALSLLGDGAAMAVDFMTYLANIYAEHIRTHHGFISNRAKWLFKVIIPTFALFSLLAVTSWIASDAIVILFYPSVETSDDLDVSFLWGFSSANMVVDAICTVAFSLRGRAVFYQELEDALFTSGKTHLEVGEVDHTHIQKVNDVETTNGNIKTDSVVLETMDDADSVNTTIKEVNLNMLSAFTHISADTLRTITVFIAAAVSTSTGIRPDIVDAYAAIVVCGIIVCISLPLGQEIFKAIKSIRNESSS